MSTVATATRGGLQVTQGRVMRSEWTKLRSLRSSRWSVLAAVVLTIGLPCLFAAVIASQWGTMSLDEQASHHPLDIALSGMIVAQLPVAVLGVLSITGEFATGMIRATMSAVPSRLPVLWAKAAVHGVVWFLVMAPAVLAAFLASQAILARHDILQISLSTPGVARSLLGASLYLVVVAVLGLGIGAIVRNTAASTSVFGALMFMLSPLLLLLPRHWHDGALPYLPQSAGSAAYSLDRGAHSLAAWSGLAVFGGYAALTLALAAALLVRRNT